jgi:hypothetical protein
MSCCWLLLIRRRRDMAAIALPLLAMAGPCLPPLCIAQHFWTTQRQHDPREAPAAVLKTNLNTVLRFLRSPGHRLLGRYILFASSSCNASGMCTSRWRCLVSSETRRAALQQKEVGEQSRVGKKDSKTRIRNKFQVEMRRKVAKVSPPLFWGGV